MKILQYAKVVIFKLFLVLMGCLIGLLLRRYSTEIYHPSLYFTWQFIVTFIIGGILFQYLRDLGLFDNII